MTRRAWATSSTLGENTRFAIVTCTENVLTEVSEAAHAGATVVATNVLVRRPDGWRVQVHHGSPVLGELTDG